MKTWLGFAFAILIGLPLLAEETVTPPATDDQGTYFMCKNGASVRTIRVQKQGDACRTFYTKDGVDSVVSKSKKADICADVANRIKTNLESGNWKCKDISQARVSSSLE